MFEGFREIPINNDDPLNKDRGSENPAAPKRRSFVDANAIAEMRLRKFDAKEKPIHTEDELGPEQEKSSDPRLEQYASGPFITNPADEVAARRLREGAEEDEREQKLKELRKEILGS